MKKQRERVNFVQVYEGEKVYPRMKRHKMRCCDCGLVHVVNFSVTKDRKVGLRVWRDERSSAAGRRYHDFKCKVVKK